LSLDFSQLPKEIEGIPKAKPKPQRIFIADYFWWDFRRDWQPLVELGKKVGAKFDKDLKKWRILNPDMQFELARRLLKAGEPAENINLYDFETQDLLPVKVWMQRLTTRPTSIVQRVKVLEPQVICEGSRIRAKIALKPSGRPVKRDDLLLWGLVTIGCESTLQGDDYILNKNKAEAMDYLVNNSAKKTEIVGIPPLPITAFITEMYTDDEIFPHQKVGINFLYSRKRAILADDMGLGKTAQSILAANQVYAEGMATSLVVVCPVTLQANWKRELHKWDSSFDTAVIIPYSRLHKIGADDIPQGSIVIFDESHYLKNAMSRRTQCAVNLMEQCKEKVSRLWLLTGTPVTKDNSDLWSTAMLVGHPLKKLSPLRLAGMRGDDNAVLSGALKTHMLMRKKCDCLNLPPKIRQTVDVDTKLARHVDTSILRAGNPDAIMEHLMKLKRMSAEAKIEAAIEFVEPLIQAGNKVVLFSDHTSPLHKIYSHFGDRSAVLLDGTTKQRDRDDYVQRFQNEASCMLFCGNIKAAGVGITLTASTIVVFVDLTWLPSDVHQAEDRCHRIGTTGTVNVYYLTDPELITDNIILRILGNRSGEIASFEGAKQTALAEVQAWVDRHG
jgi:hypothetical protein